MYLMFINLFNERIVQALCWTLVHSLWQGLLLAILTGVVILLTRRSGPVIRYNMFSILFLLFFLGSCVTFGVEWRETAVAVPGQILTTVQDHPSASGLTVGNAVAGAALPAAQLFTDRLVDFFNAHASFLVAIWFVVFSMRLVMIVAQLGAVQRLRHYRTHSPTAYWKDRVQELAERLGIKIPVTLLESEIVKAPMMAGFIKPMILLPFSLLSQLPPQQVEAILLHELAHIRRRDYMVNIIQRFAEVLFFFNPGVLWISTLIREERENCCDDIAIAQAGDKKEFIHALVSFQEHEQIGNKYALAFPGSGNHLLQRVRRIIYRDNKTLDLREKFFLLCCFLITGALILAFSRNPQSYLPVRKAAHAIGDSIPAVQKDTVKEIHVYMRAGDGGADSIKAALDAGKEAAERREMREKKDTAEKKELYEQREMAERREISEQREAFEQKIAAERREISEQKEATERKDAVEQKEPTERKDAVERKEPAEREEAVEQKEPTERKEAVEQKEAAERREISEQKEATERNEAVERKEAVEKEIAKRREPRQAYRDTADPVNEAAIARQQMKLEAEARALADQQRQLAKQQNELSAQERLLGEQQRMLVMQKMKADQGQQELANKLYGDAWNEQIRKMAPEQKKKMEEDLQTQKDLVNSLSDQLFGDKLIGNKKEFSIRLNAERMVVNGIEQPKEIAQRYRDKYIQRPGDEIFISLKKDGTGSTRINITQNK